MKKIISILVVIAVVVGIKFFNKMRASNEIRDKAIAEMQAELGFELGEDYVKELVEYAHPDALDAAYTMGGRRKSDTFDDAAYGQVLFSKMAEKLQADGKPEMAIIFKAMSGKS